LPGHFRFEQFSVFLLYFPFDSQMFRDSLCPAGFRPQHLVPAECSFFVAQKNKQNINSYIQYFDTMKPYSL